MHTRQLGVQDKLELLQEQVGSERGFNSQQSYHVHTHLHSDMKCLALSIECIIPFVSMHDYYWMERRTN